MRPQYEVADIFRLYGEEYKKTHAMTDNQRKVMAAITACRTAQLGGHSEVCDKCGTISNSYNSCRNRHCPKCQTLAKEKWPEQVLEYLGRYTHRIAISNHRIKEVKGGKVTFSYKDLSHDNQTKEMTISGVEFIRRFLLHVLPFRFMKIRYYGFLANICKKKSVLLIRRLIGKDMSRPYKEQETTRDKLLRLTGRDIGLCPECKTGEMLFQRILMPP